MSIKFFQFKLSAIFIIFISVILFTQNETHAEEVTKEESTGPVSVSAAVNHGEITIGDKVRFTIKVEYDPEIEVTFPGFSEKLADFDIKKHGKSKPAKLKNGKFEKKEWYVLDRFVIGSYIIPALKVEYKTPDGQITELETNEVFVEVKSVVAEGETVEDIREISEPVDIPVDYTLIYIIIGGTFGILAIIGGTVFYIIKRKKGKVKIGPPPLPAHEIAYRELQDLSESDLISKGMIQEYYYRLSNIVRYYIERRFSLMAPERTTEEFLYEMTKSSSFERLHKELIKKFMEQCDLVKFAKYGPDKNEIDAAFNAAKKLVDETIPVVVTQR